jgi:hypothetical protein
MKGEESEAVVALALELYDAVFGCGAGSVVDVRDGKLLGECCR